MNSHECFVVHAGSHLYIWQGTQSTYEQQQWAVKVADFLKVCISYSYLVSGFMLQYIRSLWLIFILFWLGLRGKENVSTNKVSLETIRDPHLFAFSLSKGKFEVGLELVEDVYNFDQDDLLPEDMLVLDTHAEVFVWVGQAVDTKEKKNALDYGQVFR
ncbi:hypothetical protein L1987_04281 [Smallanthus sonchifolius]|uniref:Uncharacterized protein n=1 Tax=Smallanthus sonchifolius TaxID=185202 RepID=A0ACB9KD15_9ASTR|nr:hypothetical protein L1987_04281 [Smallanthus sonchifolius]